MRVPTFFRAIIFAGSAIISIVILNIFEVIALA
jgi:hypothetical protein